MLDEQFKFARILIVDDTEANVELLLTLLEDEGYSNAVGITDPRRLQNEIYTRMPDLILLDIRMPHLSGIEVLSQLRAQYDQNMPATIVLTAQIDNQTRYEALNLGAQDFITKPFDHAEVLQRIKNTLQISLLSRQRGDRAHALELEIERRNQELFTTARLDPVTMLPNRRHLTEFLDGLVVSDTQCCLYFIYIDGIEEITSLHDYSVSDAVLQALGKRMSHYASHDDEWLGVWGSHEWLFMTERELDNQQVGDVAREIIALFQEPIYVQNMRFHLYVRVGVSVYEHENILGKAALALPQKNGVWRQYDEQLEARYVRHTEMRQELALCLNRHELFLMFQPKVSAEKGRIVGAEVLLRWNNSRFGAVSPVEFIPLLESTGMIVQVGEWVISEALRYLSIWRQSGVVDDNFSLAVNVSSIQLLEDSFSTRLLNLIEESGVPHRLIEIEVTESSLMQDMDKALKHLVALSASGVKIALDDFGTGYSSLAYLKTLPIDVLKVDRAFIREIHENERDRKLTDAVVEIAHNMNFVSVAEGVELPAQLALLQNMGCDVIQGFLFSPPLKDAALLAMLKNQSVFEPIMAMAESERIKQS